MFGISEERWKEMWKEKGLQYSDWHRKFIFIRKINDQWVFFRYVHFRHEVYLGKSGGGHYIGEDYAINEFELLAKSYR